MIRVLSSYVLNKIIFIYVQYQTTNYWMSRPLEIWYMFSKNVFDLVTVSSFSKEYEFRTLCIAQSLYGLSYPGELLLCGPSDT